MSVDLKVRVGRLGAKSRGELLLFPVRVHKGRAEAPRVAGLPRVVKQRLAELVAAYSGDSTVGAIDSAPLPARAPFKRVALVALGGKGALPAKDFRLAGAQAAKWCQRQRGERAVLALDPLWALGGAEALAAWVEGARLAAFRFDELKAKRREEQGGGLKSLELLSVDPPAEAARICRKAVAVTDAVCLTRRLGHTPPNLITPVTLAVRAQELAQSWGLKCEVLDEEALRAQGMSAFLAVGMGSAQRPRLIILEHAGRDPEAAPVVLVGKAVTLDTGGISLKPAESIPRMKFDKQGGMTVLGVMKALAELKFPGRVVGLLAAAENMLSGEAYRPGDIIRAKNGKTIEVVNTDAEGRMVLADTLHYAELRYRPAVLIDLATLTGAISVALGEHAAGLFSPDEKLAAALTAAGERTDERLWRLPLWPIYRKQIEGADSDLKNSGGRQAGSITAALFLKEFVTERTPWAHLDIAGTAMVEKGGPLWTAGATGFGVRLLLDFLEQRQAGSQAGP